MTLSIILCSSVCIRLFDEFSVLMSVYAGEQKELFTMCLNSIKAQTLQATEVVIVYDGPIGDELKRCVSNAKTEIPIVVVPIEKNVGLAMALDIGLSHCKNEFIIRCDSDDYNYPKRFEILIEALSKASSDVAVIGSSISEVDQLSGITVSRRMFQPEVSSYNWSMRDPIAHPSVILRGSVIKRVGGYAGPLFFEDTYLWLRLMKVGYKFRNLDQCLVKMTINSNFYSRRGGFRYAIYELKAFSKFYSASLISAYQYLTLFLRMPVRLMPRLIVQKIYQYLLRRL